MRIVSSVPGAGTEAMNESVTASTSDDTAGERTSPETRTSVPRSLSVRISSGKANTRSVGGSYSPSGTTNSMVISSMVPVTGTKETSGSDRVAAKLTAGEQERDEQDRRHSKEIARASGRSFVEHPGGVLRRGVGRSGMYTGRSPEDSAPQ
jgi:hypothetical protein